jgi:hypothetical protein
MAASAVKLLNDDALRARFAEAARLEAADRYRASKIIPIYESFYEETLANPVRDWS